MNKLLDYIVNAIASYMAGYLEVYPDPDPPAGLGTPLTQDEIDFVKRLKKEMDDRFTQNNS